MGMIEQKKRIMMMQSVSKNLISLAWPEGVAEPGASGNGNPRTFTPKTYVVGLSSSNYYRRNYSSWLLNPSVSVQNGVSFTSGNASGYGIGFVIDNFEGGRTYDVSHVGNASCAMVFYGNDGTYLGYEYASNRQVTAPNNAVVGILLFYSANPRTEYTATNIKITNTFNME